MLKPLETFRLRGWSIVMETPAGFQSPLPILPVLPWLNSSSNSPAAYWDGLQASGADKMSVQEPREGKTDIEK